MSLSERSETGGVLGRSPQTIVCFHAHPDDEAISTGGIMALAADAGHEVVLVLGTGGEVGEVADGFLDPGETLGDRRAKEVREAAAILGAGRVEFLGYRDSGMMGEPTNDDPACFWQADVEEAAAKLAALLAELGADVFTCYDSHGTYGHPDHIQVHRVGRRAAELAAVPRVYEATANRTAIQTNIAEARAQAEESGQEVPDLPDPAEMEDFGSTDDEITTAVDVSAVIGRKREALRAHASQIDEQSFFLALDDDAFLQAFGTEWLIRVDDGYSGTPGPNGRETSVFG